MHNDFVFSGSDDTYCIQWDLRDSGKVVHIYSGHQDAVRCMSISEEGDVYTGSFDHSVRRWDMNGVMKLIDEENKLNEQIKLLEQQQADKHSDKKRGKDSATPKRSGSASSSRPSTSRSRPSSGAASRTSVRPSSSSSTTNKSGAAKPSKPKPK
jgi:hypothetical protein